MAKTTPRLHATFDFSKVGRKWQDQFAESADIVTRIIVNAERPVRRKRDDEDDQDYDDYVQAFYDNKELIGAQIREQAVFQAKLIVDVLIDVPREWLLPDAPEKIDWSNVDSLDYIQASYYGEIIEQVRSGSAMKKAKN